MSPPRSLCGTLLRRSFLFFKQKTAYEMRISDWSSDVCSSDLLQHRDQVAIVATDDDPSKAIAGRINHRLHRVSAKDIDPVDQARWPALQGPHNAQNAVCAIAVCRVLGLGDEAIECGLAT